MCIAIAKPAGKVITDEVLKTCYDKNKDGCGFAYIHTYPNGHKKIKIEKMMEFDRFLTRFRRAEQYNVESPFLIHFRIGTAGIKTTFNCHPFKVNKNLVFIHNGIISGVGLDKNKSDTQLFNEKILKVLPTNWLNNSAIKLLVEDFIGLGSKLAFLDIDGEFHFSNEAKGVWDGGIWYSNTGYKLTPSYYQQFQGNRQSNYASCNYASIEYKRKEKKSKTVSIYEFESCEFCNSVHNIRKMKVYSVNGEIMLLCPTCEKELLQTSQITNHDKRDLWHYRQQELKRENSHQEQMWHC